MCFVCIVILFDKLTLTGKKTLTDNDLISLQMLGLQINGTNFIHQLSLEVA